MVDAISAVNNMAKTYIQKKKEEDIAWERLTASEVLGYASQGQDIPVAIMNWAEEISKLQDAPDDVTYESVNGSTNLDEITSILSNSDNSNTEDAAEKTSLTQAQQYRETLDGEAVSLYNQGKIFSDRSLESVSEEQTMEDSLDGINTQSEVIVNQVEAKSSETERRTASMKEELDNLLAKAQSKDKSLSPGDLNKIATLGNLLNNIGTQSQQEIADLGAELTALEVQIQQFNTIPPTATDFGTETVDIGAELMGSDENRQNTIVEAARSANGVDSARAALEASERRPFLMLFDRNYRMGVLSVSAGGNAMDAGVAGTDAIEYAQAHNDEQFARVEAAQSTVEDSTGIEAIDIPRLDASPQDNNQIAENNNNTDNNNNAERETSEEVKISASKTDETDVKDSTLVIDTDEKKKRREEKGLA